MIHRGLKSDRGFECVLVDLNTQRDFCEPNGAYPVANLRELIPSLRRVYAWVRSNKTPVISSFDSHRLTDTSFDGGPPHCLDGTWGQRKLSFTLFPQRICVEADNTLSVPGDLFTYYQQVIFRERTEDLLGNPKADRFINILPAREFILVGNSLESAVKALALGLLARERRVSIVVDACGYWSMSKAEYALRLVDAKGGQLITVEELAARQLNPKPRYRPFMPNGRCNGSHESNGQPRIKARPGSNGSLPPPSH